MTMASEPLWKIGAKRLGAPRKFETPEALQEAVLEYFQWLEENPLKESKLVSYQGVSTLETVPKMRAATIDGLCLHAGITSQTWRNFREERDDLFGVIAWAERCIREQKFTGAAADLLNANIISRDLGLADRAELSGPNGQPMQVELSELPPDEQARRIAFLFERGMRSKAEKPE